MAALKPEAYEQWKQNLIEFELWEEDEVIEEYIKGDYWDFGSQKRGQYLFTNKKVVFVGWTYWSVNYKDIKEVTKCNVGGLIPLIPTGIKLTYFDEKKGKNKKYKMSVLKRKEWIEYLSKKAGLMV